MSFYVSFDFSGSKVCGIHTLNTDDNFRFTWNALGGFSENDVSYSSFINKYQNVIDITHKDKILKDIKTGYKKFMGKSKIEIMKDYNLEEHLI